MRFPLLKGKPGAQLPVDRAEKTWEERLHIRTTGRDGFKVDERHHAYEPTPYVCLERLEEAGYITAENTVLDYGSGKGRVPIFLAERTGCRAIGVDFDAWMVKKAEANRDAWASFKGDKAASCRERIRFVCAEAEDFDPSLADRFFNFNPFPSAVLRSTLKKILRLWRNEFAPEGKTAYLFFYYPSDEYVSALMKEDELCFEDEISCRDLFPKGSEREKILVFRTVS